MQIVSRIETEAQNRTVDRTVLSDGSLQGNRDRQTCIYQCYLSADALVDEDTLNRLQRYALLSEGGKQIT